MPVTVADVVRALLAAAPEDALARPWLAGLLPGLDTADLVSKTTAPPASHPFASEVDHQAALLMLAKGAHGREIAADFDIPRMAAAVWAQRSRVAGGGTMSPRQLALMLLAAAPAALLADLPTLGMGLPFVVVLTWCMPRTLDHAVPGRTRILFTRS